MKEPVKRTNHPWLVGVCVAAIGAGYFMLLGKADFPEPGRNLDYNAKMYAELDNVDTRYEETGMITPGVEDPQALTIGPDGNLYVAGKDEVVVFGKNDTETSRIKIDGTPKCMAVDSDGTLFVGFPHHIEVLHRDGSTISIWEELNARSYITSIAIHGDNIFVADAANRVVLHYDREGNLQNQIGKKNEAEDIPGIEVPSPYLDLAINEDGDLWVVNPGLLGLERYRNDGSIVTSWYNPNLKLEGFSGCCNPTHIAFSNDGSLITAEKGLVRIKVYDVTSGEYKELIAGSKLFPREQSLRDIAVDSNDRILVLDPRKDVIRIFELKENDDEKENDQPA